MLNFQYENVNSMDKINPSMLGTTVDKKNNCKLKLFQEYTDIFNIKTSKQLDMFNTTQYYIQHNDKHNFSITRHVQYNTILYIT